MPLANSQIIHPRVLASIPYHFPSQLTITRGETSYDDFNEPITTYAPSPQLTAIAAYIEPNTTGRVETEQPYAVFVSGEYVCVLQGYFPSISRTDRATVDGVDFGVVDVRLDDFRTITYLGLERINKDTEMDYA